MAKTDWVTKTKDHLLGAACVALVGMVVTGVGMLLRHDKMITLLDYKMNIVLKHVAPDVPIPKSPNDILSDNSTPAQGYVKSNADSRPILH